MKKIITTIITIIILTQYLHADAGIPMIALSWPIFWITLIPVIFIEWLIIKKTFNIINKKTILKSVALSNLISTLLGIPLAWIACTAIEFFLHSYLPKNIIDSSNIVLKTLITLTSIPWLPGEPALWIIASAHIALLIPFFYVSYFFEADINTFLLKKHVSNIPLLRKTTFKANLISYLFLTLTSIVLFIVIDLTKPFN